MKKYTKLLAALLALALVFSFAGCRKDSGKKGPITVTDMTGRTITLDHPAEKVVALSAADCDIVYAVGAFDTLIGRGEMCDYPEQVKDLPSVQSGYNTNTEEIVKLAPEVLIMSTMAQTQEQVDALEAAGIKVVVSDAQDIEGIYTSIELIGAVTGHAEDAAKVVADMKKAFDDLKAQVKGDGTETVYFEVSPLKWGLWSAGSGTFMNELAEMMGVKNIFADQQGWIQVSEEQVIERAPDYIVTITMSSGEGDDPVAEILGRPGWEHIPAVENKKILNAPNNELTRPSQRLVEGAQMFYDFIYGK
ncbi:MAG: ABC transporter substrate-binding protein [Eubacteriaceae bacterium]|nr:ABC transporter substrate-binding protein [Eubacteriaceae bacterium]